MVALGLFVLFKNPSARLNQLFAGCAASLALWTFGYSLMYLSKYPDKALFFARLGYVGIVFIPTFFLHFVLEFLQINRPRTLRAAYAVSFLFLALSRFDVFIAGVYTYFWGYYPRAGPLYCAFILYFYGCCSACVIYLRRTYVLLRNSGQNSLKLNQVKYVLLAFFVASLSISDYLPNYHIQVYPFAYLVAYGWLVFMAYAIFKYRVIDIDVFIRKTVIYSVVTAALTAVYVAVMTLLARGFEGWLGSSTLIPSVAAACIMAFLFHPLTVRMQRWIDRKFPREALDQTLLREATSGFVHEIKRPLANITVPAELIFSDLQALVDRPKELDAFVLRTSHRIQYIINQAMEAGYKMEAIRELSTDQPSAKESIALQEIILAALAPQKEGLEKQQIRVTTVFPADDIMVNANSAQLRIAFSNLIKNAGESWEGSSSKNARTIEIIIALVKSDAEIRVKDSGRGIKSHDLQRIFEPYFSTKGSSGMGVGLYLVKQVIKTHKGTIEVQSKEGEGSEFIIRLPLMNPNSPR